MVLETLPSKKTSELKVILTGATGFVGEGVLWATLDNPAVAQVLIICRRPYLYNGEAADKHPSGKLRELVVADFFNLEEAAAQTQEPLTGYDACFYCAGKSARGMSEAEYTHLTYDMVMYVAATLVKLNPGMVMCHLSGALADSTEKGRAMWARVKGRAENALLRLPFRSVYNFRPGAMQAIKGQQGVTGVNAFYSGVLFPVVHFFSPSNTLTMREIGSAMVNCVIRGNPLHILEVKDIKEAAKG